MPKFLALLRGRSWLLIFLGLIVFSGCSVRQGTLDTLMSSKAGTLGDWGKLNLDGEPLLQVLTKNTALLLSPAEGLEIDTMVRDGVLHVGFRYEGKKPGFDTKHGSAVPITNDGYFLTAAHCLESPSALIVFDDDGVGSIRVIKTRWRVVWRSGDKHELDLAVIHAPVRLARAFKLAGAESLKLGAPVAVTGWSGFFQGNPMVSQAAGRVLEISEPRGQQPGPAWRVVRHDAPMHPGDSGGPLVDRSGRLIGTHSLIRLSRRGAMFSPRSMKHLGYSGEAVAPDLGWLRAVIAADRRARR